MKRNIYKLALLVIIMICFISWFDFPKTLSSGDWPYLFPENIREFQISTQPPFLWLEPYYQLTAKFGVEYLSLPWELVERIFWFFPFIFISAISSWIFVSFFLKSFSGVKQYPIFSLIGSLIYTANTYILMIVGGGQMGVAMAYVMAPLVLHRLFTLLDSNGLLSQKFKIENSRPKDDRPLAENIKYVFFSVLILAIQLMFDPRIFVLTLFAGFLFIIFQFATTKQLLTRALIQSSIITGVAIVLNFFWIIPNVVFYQTHYVDAVNAVEIKFLSFAKFSNAFSLLHPNWPENLFGKTYFLKPEFLLLPILAYSSLLFISLKLKTKNFKNDSIILFFVFLGLLGSFLAKGVNPPFGELNRLLYTNVPGMSIFRDPTKFYLLTILSYSVLIPFSVYSTHSWLKSKFPIKGWFTYGGKIQNYIPPVFLLFVFCYLLLLVRPAWMGNLGGTFKPKNVPREYIAFKELIKKDSHYSPVLWIPIRQRFGFYSDTHPAIEAQDIVGTIDSKEFTKAWRKQETKKLLKEEGVRYIVLPYDSQKEIFLNGYIYAPIVRSRVEKTLDRVQWLKKIQNGKIDIYEVTSFD